MSVEALTWAFEQDVPTGAKFLLVAIANDAGRSGIAFTGRASLAQACSCTKTTVSTNMARLEEQGLVRRFERRRKNGSRTSDWIVLAPAAADRGPMHDAVRDEYPVHIAELAQVKNPDVGPGGSGQENVPGQVKNSGSPEPLEEPPVSSSPTPSSEPIGFSEWLGHHVERAAEHGIRQSVPRAGTSARATLAATFGALVAEGYSLDEFKLASDGVLGSEFMRGGGHVKPENVLRKSKMAGRVDEGRRWRAAKDVDRGSKWGDDE